MGNQDQTMPSRALAVVGLFVAVGVGTVAVAAASWSPRT